MLYVYRLNEDLPEYVYIANSESNEWFAYLRGEVADLLTNGSVIYGACFYHNNLVCKQLYLGQEFSPLILKKLNRNMVKSPDTYNICQLRDYLASLAIDTIFRAGEDIYDSANSRNIIAERISSDIWLVKRYTEHIKEMSSAELAQLLQSLRIQGMCIGTKNIFDLREVQSNVRPQ